MGCLSAADADTRQLCPHCCCSGSGLTAGHSGDIDLNLSLL